jgi:hypothetical protein
LKFVWVVNSLITELATLLTNTPQVQFPLAGVNVAAILPVTYASPTLEGLRTSASGLPFNCSGLHNRIELGAHLRPARLLGNRIVDWRPKIAPLASANMTNTRKRKMSAGDPVVAIDRHVEYAQTLCGRRQRLRIE